MRRFSISKVNDLFFTLLFFPFWKILPGPRVQPIAVFLVFFLLLKAKKIKTQIFFILLMLTIVVVWSFLVHIEYSLRARTISALVLFIPVLIGLGVTYTRKVEKLLVLKVLTMGFAVLALFQSLPYLDFMLEPLRWFIPIGHSVSINAYRGVSLLSPEPSNAAFVIATLCWFWYLNHQRLSIVYSVALGILILTNRSGTLILLLIPYLYIYAKRLGVIFFLSIIVIFGFLSSFIDVRVFDVVNNIAFIIQSGLWSQTEYWYLVSGPRFVEVFIAYKEALNNLLGLGLGSIESNYTLILQESGVSMGKYWDSMVDAGFFTNSRPNSYMSYLAITLGIIPMFVILFVLLGIVWNAPKGLKIFGYMAILLLLFRGTITMPYPWIIFGSILTRYDLCIN